MTEPIATLVDLFLPRTCAGCTAAGGPLCPRCAATLGRPCPVDVPDIGPPVFALAGYRDVPRALVLAFKELGRRDLAAPLGARLAAALPLLDVPLAADGARWLVPAPSRPAAARRRGGGHLSRLAHATANALARKGSPTVVAPALGLAAGARDSVGLDAAARAANLAGRMRFRAAGRVPPGTPVVLLDDVVTTGATAAACVGQLARHGVEVAAVLALTAVRTRDRNRGEHDFVCHPHVWSSQSARYRGPPRFR